MLIIILILANVFLVTLFRLYPVYKVRNLQAIVANYFVCYAVGSLLVKGQPLKQGIWNEEWFPYAVFISILFIVFFNVTAFAIQKIGLIISTIAQKLSLVFPVILGILAFGESLGILKGIAICFAIISIILINIPDKTPSGEINKLRAYWYLPALVTAGAGLIEITLFFVQEKGMVENASLDFVSITFLMAGIWGLIYMVILQKEWFSTRDVLGGVFLGIPNYFTIYLLIKALEAGWDGSVLFPVNNVSTLALVTLVGLFLFKERLNRYNLAGLVLAVLAVWMISR